MPKEKEENNKVTENEGEETTEKSFAESNLDNGITDDFELLSSYTNDNYTRVTKVLNINGGCIVNTIIIAGSETSVTSLFVPGNHIRDGKIGPM